MTAVITAPAITDIVTAAAALTAGTIDKAALIAFAKANPVETEPLLRLMTGGQLTMHDVSEVLVAQRAFASPGRQPGALSFKVSEKGAISIYGLQSRFPVTLYRSQLERLLKHAPELNEFMKVNASKLSEKAAK
ncbi:hypothetical protein [Anatilimnocola floriformis]|uniref:hypothetical protein n=1 Tax=Anatilimnocola floriformis TaxID=2948575 RepID=UPI0020C2E5C6|nr:hypothetical protein [Anatilimnocola floriformis]